MGMFCFQCEQTAKGTGCTEVGVCGKDATTATLQDLLLRACREISLYAHEARKQKLTDRKVDRFVVEALFTTVTNVNFDSDEIVEWIHTAADMLDLAKETLNDAALMNEQEPIVINRPELNLRGTKDELVALGATLGVKARLADRGPDVTGLEELITYGLKGMAAYLDHAMILGRYSETAIGFIHQALSSLIRPRTVGELTNLALKVGEVNLEVMELLDYANTSAYGHPVPTQVRIEPIKGKAILISGHDLKDLDALLKQTEGKGINVYTHGEMLPCHGYPELKKFKHLVGNYGGAWQDQRKEFEAFPGAILMTTNCIQKPRDSYNARIFTTGLVQYPGVVHVTDEDFSAVIAAALEAPGFTEDGPEKYITVGFGHEAVLGVADKVIAAVKAGQIKHFFLVGGCDGAKPGRNYYTEFVEKSPKDTVILTLACGKYRFNKMDLGDIGGIPRLLDIGQCNDAYSAIKIAGALADAFGTDVNGLPLSFILSWYEQKAVVILLTLLHLGIKNIKLGPTLPTFVSPAVLNVLVNTFNIGPVTNVDDDLRAALGN
jgi:hydroxylamine reductase